MSNAVDPIAGRTFRHHKGNLYDGLFVATHSETNDELAVYFDRETGRHFARPLKMFREQIDREGYSGPRFREVPGDGPRAGSDADDDGEKDVRNTPR